MSVASYLAQENLGFVGSSYRRVLGMDETVLFIWRIHFKLVQVGGGGLDLHPLQTPTSIAPPRLFRMSCILCRPAFGVWVWVSGLGFRAWSLGLVDWGVGFCAWVLVCGCGVCFGVRGLGFGLLVVGLGAWTLGFGVWGLEFGCGVWHEEILYGVRSI